MSTTLDSFLPYVPAPQSTAAEPKCFKCSKAMSDKETWYWLKTKETKGTKGKTELHCQSCAKQVLRPQEDTEENL